VVAALGTDGIAYVLEDLTLKAGPATWGGVATAAFDRHSADIVVGEDNFGGAMVQHVITTARSNTPYKAVKASRGKVVRAEPISALYEQGKVKHVGYFPELEDELMSFTTTGYQGLSSPNRADALVWAITELFPGLTRGETDKIDTSVGLDMPLMTDDGWMAA
jgi:phage terminase large subunit-like protein